MTVQFLGKGVDAMTDYNFLADLPDTFKSSPDWIKAFELGRALCDAAAFTKLAPDGNFSGARSNPFRLPVFPTMVRAKIGRNGPVPGRRNLSESGWCQPQGTSSTYMAGEASAYVQSFGLKAVAVVSRRLTNSPVTRGQPR